MIIKRFAFWNPGTWQIPKLYWDAFSDEQRIHAICKQLGKVIAYADYLGINVDDIAERLKAIEEGQLDQYIIDAIEQWFEDNQPAIMTALQNLNDALPISDFDSVNTVKAALDNLDGDIDALEDKFPIVTAEISDDAITTPKIADGAVTESKIAPDFVRRVDTIAESNYPTSSIEPIYVGDILTKSGLQGVAVNGDDAYMAFRDGNNITPNIKRISLENGNVVKTYTNALIGHGNSLAYDTVRDKLFIASGTIYTIDRTLTTFATFPDQPGNTNCIAFDNVTFTLWAMTGLAADPTQNLYKMESDESEFSLFAVIDNIAGRQDIAVNNDVLYINTTRADCSIFSINRDSNSISFIDSITFAHHDTANRWTLSEPEGICIDSDGRFWLGYNNSSAYTNADGTTTCNGFLCNIPYKGVSYPAIYTTTLNHEILYMNTTAGDAFKLGITSIKSFAQCLWMNTENVREIQINTNYTDEHAGCIPKGALTIGISTGCTLTLTDPLHAFGGFVQFRNQGTLVCDTTFIIATNVSLLFVMRNTGIITITNGTGLISYGVVPNVSLINNAGTLSGTYTIGGTAITGNNQYIIGGRTGTY